MKPKKKRKTALAGLLLALLLPMALKADTQNLGVSFTARPFGSGSQAASVLYGLDTSTDSLRQVAVDANGNIKTTQGSAGGATVTAYQGTSPWVINGTVVQGSGLPGGNVSNSWLTSDNYVAGWLTQTAGGAAASGGSITAVAITGTVLTNITFAAGADTPCIVTIEPGAGPNAGFYWGILPSSTWVAPVSYLAVSTTPIMVTVGRGDFLQLSATAAAVTVNARVRYAPIK